MTDEQLPEESLAALREGNLIQAIKVLREQRNLGLKEAKDIVEDYAKTQPDIMRRIQERQNAPGGPIFAAVLALIVLALIFFVARK